MRDLFELNQYRRCEWELRAHGVLGDRGNGCFVIERNGIELCCLASNGGGWDHVSVSTSERCPTWEEMSFIHRLFARPGETWVQFHVPETEHVNEHPYCLHLWRKQSGQQSKPPATMVGRVTRDVRRG